MNRILKSIFSLLIVAAITITLTNVPVSAKTKNFSVSTPDEYMKVLDDNFKAGYYDNYKITRATTMSLEEKNATKDKFRQKYFWKYGIDIEIGTNSVDNVIPSDAVFDALTSIILGHGKTYYAYVDEVFAMLDNITAEIDSKLTADMTDEEKYEVIVRAEINEFYPSGGPYIRQSTCHPADYAAVFNYLCDCYNLNSEIATTGDPSIGNAKYSDSSYSVWNRVIIDGKERYINVYKEDYYYNARKGLRYFLKTEKDVEKKYGKIADSGAYSIYGIR